MMRLTRGYAVFGMFVLAVASTADRAAAQAYSAVPLTLDRSVLNAVHEYKPKAGEASSQLAVPDNFAVTSIYRDLVGRMLARSKTFRRQLRRIAHETSLSIIVQSVMRPWQLPARATTHILRATDGSVQAVIEVPPLDDDVELIAHELEHVIEQLDEVDLVAKSRIAGSGVRVVSEKGLYETMRAVRTGLTVSDEFQAATRRGD